MKGYTLIETLIYTALFVLLLGAIINSLMLLTNSYQNVKTTRDIEVSAVSSMDRMTREIQNATSIDGSGTTYNTSPGSLLLNTGDRFYLSNGVVMMDKAGSVFGPLSRSTVTVNSLIFRHITSTSSQAIKIEIIINNKNFYGTAVLRGSYN